MKWVILILLLFIALLLESTVITLPLVFIVLLCSAVIYKQTEVLILAFVGGILIDILSLHTIGVTGIFFLVTLALAFLYERKFEIQSLPFVVIFSFIGSFVYVLLFVGDYVLIQAIVSCVLASGIFLLFRCIIHLNKLH